MDWRARLTEKAVVEGFVWLFVSKRIWEEGGPRGVDGMS